MTKPEIKSVKGTRDYYPREMGLRNFLYEKARQVSESFGYQEYDGPFLETLELYAAKSGEELVKEQSFVFADRGGELITLRPELTPTLARMVAQRQRQLVFPLRWWSWGPFWRYERPQKGRTREFFQWNIDLIGVDTPQADAEMIAIAASFLEACGLTPQEVHILVNNRQLMEEELLALGIPCEKRLDVFHLIDRRDKLSPEDWREYALEIGLSASQHEALTHILEDEGLWKKSERLQRVFEIAQLLGIGAYVRYSPHVIRGLDYYTSTVFEAWDAKREFRAILGGGRYDNLVADVGGAPVPAIGFAMGDLVISLVLEAYGHIPPDLEASPASILITVFDETTIGESFRLAAELRAHGFKVACYPEASKLTKQIKYADRMGMQLVILLGPDEISQEMVAIKDLHRGEQIHVPRSHIQEALMKMLERREA